jgi:hypothetical protein
MLLQRHRDLDSDFHADFSHGEAARAEVQTQPVDHHCQICPTCSHRLTGHRCKLICTHCGYYMSCADYY